LNRRLPPCGLDEKELDWEKFHKFLTPLISNEHYSKKRKEASNKNIS